MADEPDKAPSQINLLPLLIGIAQDPAVPDKHRLAVLITLFQMGWTLEPPKAPVPETPAG